MTDNRWVDPEIDGLFDGDAELTELAHRARAARPEPPTDERFKGVLRAQLMREAQVTLAPRAVAPPPPPRVAGARRGWWPWPTRFAIGGGLVGAALVAAAILTVVRTTVQDRQVTYMSPVASLHAVSTSNVITVAFSQAMNQAAVVAGLHIRPATEVTTRWDGNNLVITPTHHLAGNTPYTVTIDKSATQSATGQLAAADIRIAFGTAPAPPVASSIAQLSPQQLATVSDNAQLISAGGGGVIATGSHAVATQPSAQPSATPNPSASAGPSPSPSANPSASASPGSSPSAGESQSPSPAGSSATATATAAPSPSASQSPSAAPSPSGELVLMSGRGGVTDLGPAASSAALAPNGFRLLAAVPAGSGSTIATVSLDGSEHHTLATISSPVLATGWLTNDTALVATADRIVSVDLQGRVSTLTSLPGGTTTVLFATSGGQAFAGSNGQDGQLIDLASGQARPLPGSRQLAAFSSDGSTVAWVDAAASTPQLVTSPVSRLAATAVPLDHPADSIHGLALDRSGTHLAVVDRPQGGAGSLDVLSLPSGSVIAKGPDAGAVAFSPQGDRLIFIAGGSAQVASVPGAPAGTAVNALPDGAAGALRAFVDAQVHGGASILQSLSGPGINAMDSTPRGLSRAYVVSAVANGDGTVAATARLIVDPSANQPVTSFADEALVLSPTRGGSGYVVSSLRAGQLHAEPTGPQVVAVTPISGPTLVLRVSFDSDLRAATVAPAITVATRSGTALPATTVYDPNTRTATITLKVPAQTRVVLGIATSLLDVDGQALAGAFSADTGG